MLRPIIASTVLGIVAGTILGMGVLFARAADSSNAVSIDNFTFTPKTLNLYAKNADREGWHDRDLDKSRRHSSRYRLVGECIQEIGGA